MHYTTSCNTQSSAPEDGLDHRPKHVELTGIITKLLLLHLVGVCIIYVNDARSNKYQINFRTFFTHLRITLVAEEYELLQFSTESPPGKIPSWKTVTHVRK